MLQKSKSKVSMLPLVIYMMLPILAFLLLKKYGVFLFVVFFNPIFASINQVFTHYRIENNTLVIDKMFQTEKINIDKIRNVKTRRANAIQRIFSGYPQTYQIVEYNTYDDLKIMPKNELVFVPNSRQIYFKT